MAQQRNLLTVLGCSGSLALALSMSPSALASTATPDNTDHEPAITSLTQADDNPIMDALSCSCARCVMGSVADM
ncbi:MAG: hypothetical protein AAFY17_00420 [Cyanobacteria bacterium J06642_11]